jgi:hypothetical protein
MMVTQEKNQMCDIVVQKIIAGGSLDDADKTHLANCEACMARVVRTLDESGLQERQIPGRTAGGTNGDLSRARPEAKQALEQARRVFEREFGIKLVR